VIALCSLLGRQIFNQILHYLDRRALEYIIFAFGAFAALLLITRRGWLTSTVLLGILFLAHLFFAAEELIHIFFFGALGMSLKADSRACEDNSEFLILGMIVSIADELLQSILPWRVGDLRDVALNLVSFLFGYILGSERSRT